MQHPEGVTVLFFYGCRDDRLSVDVQWRALVLILKSGMHFNGRRDKIICVEIKKGKTAFFCCKECASVETLPV